MRVLLLGKRGSLVLWLENLLTAFRRAGHEAAAFTVNGATPWQGLAYKLYRRRPTFDRWLADRLAQRLRGLRPDLVVAVGAFGVPLSLYQTLEALPQRPPLLGLVGDRFGVDDRSRAQHCDRLYFTDTSFFDDARRYGFPASCAYLPLAVDPVLFRPGSGPRDPRPLFVASRTAYREQVLRALRQPAVVYGTDWSGLRDDSARLGHRVHNRKITRRAVIRRYRRHLAVLNVRNELNVSHGLNQRPFEALACGAAVLNDDLVDLALCFEPGREILVYRDAEELNELCAQLQRTPRLAQSVAAAGRRRVLAEHTYERRVAVLLRDLGI